MFKDIIETFNKAKEFENSLNSLSVFAHKRKTYRVPLTEEQINLLRACYMIDIKNKGQLQDATGTIIPDDEFNEEVGGK